MTSAAAVASPSPATPPTTPPPPLTEPTKMLVMTLHGLAGIGPDQAELVTNLLLAQLEQAIAQLTRGNLINLLARV